jgi:hypothetical protein
MCFHFYKNTEGVQKPQPLDYQQDNQAVGIKKA